MSKKPPILNEFPLIYCLTTFQKKKNEKRNLICHKWINWILKLIQFTACRFDNSIFAMRIECVKKDNFFRKKNAVACKYKCYMQWSRDSLEIWSPRYAQAQAYKRIQAEILYLHMHKCWREKSSNENTIDALTIKRRREEKKAKIPKRLRRADI